MISDLTKKRSRREKRESRTREPQASKGAFQDPSPDADFGGEELHEFADARGLSEQDVWASIRNGDLIGRSFSGKLYVHEPHAGRDAAPPRDELPPLPLEEEERKEERHLVPGVSQASEIALLLDHLSLSKEENREILKLSQDSIGRVTQMADTIVAMKDELLKAKDDQIGGLREKVKSRETEIARLKQELEDMKMLATTLSQQDQKSPE